VVDHGGFAAAGRALGLQKSRLSRRILQVEERLGVRLLNRSSRRFSVTEIGREFYDRCVAMLVEAEAAEQVIAQVRAEPRGVVRMSCPVALLNSQFGALIAMACRHDGRAQRRHRSGGARLVLGFPAGPAGALEIGRPIQPPMLLWPKPLDLRLERGFDRPVRRLNGDHARPGIGDTASLADALDLRTLLREFASAQD
jgi:DNA-binding transcriptional LysR family regulator